MSPELLALSHHLAIVSLAVGVGGTVSIVGAALALGLRHGIDWDHIAAITDITSTTASASAREAWLTGEPGLQLTDERHHEVHPPHNGNGAATAPEQPPMREPVVARTPMAPVMLATAGAAARQGLAAGSVPVPFARPLGGVAGFLQEQRQALLLGSLYAIGHGTVVTALGMIALLASQFLPAWIDPIMGRVVGATLVFLAAYLFYSLYRFFRGGSEFAIRSRWMMVFAGVRAAFDWIRARARGDHGHHLHVRTDQQYGARTAYGIGLIHGIGAETGTQVLVIATAVGAGSKGTGVVALLAFVVGLLISNSIVTFVSTAGFISSRRRQGIYVAAGVLAAVFSLIVGVVFLLDAGGVLPALDPYFRWLGGPDA